MSITPPVNPGASFPAAEPQRYIADRGLRFGGYLLDLLLVFVTCFIGYFIWSLIIWDQGLTPAKQILKMRVMNAKTNQPARWGQMAIRQFVIGFAIGLIYYAFTLLGYLVDYGVNGYSAGLYLVFSFIGYGIMLAWSITDACWIFKPESRRVTDIIAKTYVVKEY